MSEEVKTFTHSIKVNRLFKRAAKIVKEVKEDGKGVKDLLYQEKHCALKPLYALVMETLKHNDILNKLIVKSNILINEPRLDPWLARVLMTELLWQKRELKGDAKPIETILSYETQFRELLNVIDQDVTSQTPSKVIIPRYVRINTLMKSVQEAIDKFTDEGYFLIEYDISDYSKFLERARSLEENQFMVDFHIPELLVFPHGTEFFKHPGYLDGSIVLQDKASCFPAFILNPEPGSIVLDMCAAPGMKSTQLAAIMKNKGSVIAVEHNERRYKMLCEMVKITDSKCVQPLHKDALTVTPMMYPNVKYILVDPSCSGSGMLDRVRLDDFKGKDEVSRVQKLAGFQIMILRQALQHFPNVEKVVYSTCSILPQENEEVVKKVLQSCDKFQLVPIKKLLQKEWFNFGSDNFPNVGPNCLHTKSDTDLTNGFFVAVFERIAPFNSNDVRNRRAYIQKRVIHKQVKINKDKSENISDLDKILEKEIIKSTNKAVKIRKRNITKTEESDLEDSKIKMIKNNKSEEN